MKPETRNQKLETKQMVICSPQLGLNPNSILGGEVFDREILLGLAKKGIKIEIILPRDKPHDKNVKNWNVTYLPLSRFPAVFGNFLIIPYLFKVYKNHPFDILRIHSPRFLGLGCIFFKLINKTIKLIATYHQFKETKFWLFSKIVNNYWDHIICDSIAVKNRIIKVYQISSSKITVVHNGVPRYLKPTKKDKVLMKKLNLEGKIVLLFMGLFIERKNPLFLLEVLSKLTQTRSDLVLIFWGEGPLKSQILRKAKRLGVINQIRIQKPIFGKEKNKIHNLADVFVHPSLDEGFALAPLESMACAKPVVITNGYSAKEAVEDGVNGFICHYNDTNHWSQKLNQLVTSPKLRKRIGQSSLAKIKKEFQWRFAVEEHLRVFKKLVK